MQYVLDFYANCPEWLMVFVNGFIPAVAFVSICFAIGCGFGAVTKEGEGKRGKLIVSALACAMTFECAWALISCKHVFNTIADLEQVGSYERASEIRSSVKPFSIAEANRLANQYGNDRWLHDSERLSLVMAASIVKNEGVRGEIIALSKKPDALDEEKKAILKRILALPADQLAGDGAGAASIIASLK